MKRILVIDDDPQIRTLLHLFLSRKGYTVDLAAHGDQGIELFRKNPADVVIIDLVMPEKEGLETIIELRRDFPLCRIIAISGGGRISPEDYLPLASRLGACAALSKPFTCDALHAAVEELLVLETR